MNQRMVTSLSGHAQSSQASDLAYGYEYEDQNRIDNGKAIGHELGGSELFFNLTERSKIRNRRGDDST